MFGIIVIPHDFVIDKISRLSIAWDYATEKIYAAQKTQKQNYDKRISFKANDFDVGDLVLLRNESVPKKRSKKFAPAYKGLFRVKKTEYPNAVVSPYGDHKAKEQKVNIQRLRLYTKSSPFNKHEEPPEELYTCPTCDKNYDAYDGHTWISCDKCEEWYHETCQGLSKPNIPGELDLWYCDICRYRMPWLIPYMDNDEEFPEGPLSSYLPPQRKPEKKKKTRKPKQSERKEVLESLFKEELIPENETESEDVSASTVTPPRTQKDGPRLLKAGTATRSQAKKQTLSKKNNEPNPAIIVSAPKKNAPRQRAKSKRQVEKETVIRQMVCTVDDECLMTNTTEEREVSKGTMGGLITPALGMWTCPDVTIQEFLEGQDDLVHPDNQEKH